MEEKREKNREQKLINKENSLEIMVPNNWFVFCVANTAFNAHYFQYYLYIKITNNKYK